MNAIDPRGEAAGPRASLRAFWTPPALSDPDELRQVRLLFGVVRPLIVSFASLAVVLPIPGVAPGFEGLRSSALLVACIVPFVAAMALAHRGQAKLAGTLVVTTGFLSTVASV
ncbi:MAG: hypothetical protein JST92_23000, partial [Deltaproteobacteria bacterium]|nr:hypothetical protein [Deltaproteobacteria bacterium]